MATALIVDNPASIEDIAAARRELGWVDVPRQEQAVIDLQLSHAMNDLGDWELATRRVANERIGTQGNPSEPLQIARNEVAIQRLRAEAIGNNPSLGVTHGEVDYMANLAHLRGEPLLENVNQKETKAMAATTGVGIDGDRDHIEEPEYTSSEWAEWREAGRRRERAAQLREAVDAGESALNGSEAVRSRSVNTSAERNADPDVGESDEIPAAEPRRLSFFESLRERFETWRSSSTDHASVSSLNLRPAPTPEQASEAIRQAQSGRQERLLDVMERPGVDSEREAQKILRAGEFRERLASFIPAKVRDYFSINLADERQKGIDNSYEKLVDKKADALLGQQQKAQQTLANVDPNVPLHRLSSKQYRAVETFITNEQRLKELRPIPREQYDQALAQSGTRAAVSQNQTTRVAPAETIAQRVTASQELPRETYAPAEEVRGLSTAAISEAQRMQGNREKAIAAVREITNGVRPDGFQTPAQKAMEVKIIAQLNEGRDSLNLTTRYAMGDSSSASETHAKAVQANMPLIEAVRQNGIPVDTGKAMVVSSQKKSVEVSEGLSEGLGIAG